MFLFSRVPLALARPAVVFTTVGVLGTALALLCLSPPRLIDRAEARSADPSTGWSAAKVQASVQEQRSREQWVTAIVARNIFDSSAIGRTDGAEAEVKSAEELGWTLLGVVVAEPTRFSSALLRPERGPARTVVVGDHVQDDLTVVEIGADAVMLERADGQRLRLGLPDFTERVIRDRRPPGASSGVHRVDKHHFQVDSDTIDKVLASPSGLRKLGRARAYKRRGEVVGYRLYRIRRGSLGRKIGLRSGDIVTAVNGRPIRSTQDAVALYGALKNARSLEIDVQRRRGRNKRTIRVDVL